jgi:hypothetical protein
MLTQKQAPRTTGVIEPLQDLGPDDIGGENVEIDWVNKVSSFTNVYSDVSYLVANE